MINSHTNVLVGVRIAAGRFNSSLGLPISGTFVLFLFHRQKNGALYYFLSSSIPKNYMPICSGNPENIKHLINISAEMGKTLRQFAFIDFFLVFFVFFPPVSLFAPKAFFKVVVEHWFCLWAILIYFKSISPDITIISNRGLYFPILRHGNP
jgi:hypothetical protein